MKNLNIHDFDHKKKYFEAFWENDVLDRPLISVKAPIKDSLIPVAYLEGAESGDYLPALEKTAANIKNTYFGGEALPVFDCCFGPDQFAAFLGGTITYSKEASTSWVKPFWDDGYDEDTVAFHDEAGGYFQRMLLYLKTAADFAGGRFLINMLDLHTNMDAILAARGAENLCMDLVDDPDRVERVLKKILPLFPAVVNAFARAGRMEENGYIGWIPTYSEDKFAVLQCDFSIMLSPEMTRRFVVPALEYETSCLKHNIYHYDGPGALSHLDDILAIEGIDAIQWVPGAGQPRTVEWMDLLKKIQKAGKRLWLYDWTPQEIKSRFKELDPRGLFFDLWVDTPQEGEDLISYVKNHM
jgi:hypothetical protein